MLQGRILEEGAGVHTLPPWDDLRLSNTTDFLENMQICMICILSSSDYVIA